ncbi:MAG: extracellular solute-binding protein [Clostridia bacterium]|nr:extracellular solute-binding protein [Clostridia bacterium]
MNTNLKRVLAVMLCLVMSVTLFVGCGKDTSDKDEQGRTMITVGNYPAEGTPKRETFDARLAAYNAANPDVAVTPLEWSFDLKAFYSQAAGGQLPTVFNANFTEVNPAAQAGYAADLTKVLKKRGYDGQFNQQILDALSPDGKIYSFPISSYIVGLWCNIDLFEKAGLMQEDGTPMQPKTWDELAQFAVKIKEATGKAGIVMASNSNVGGWLFTPLAWSYGVEFMKQNEDGTYTATFNSPEAAAALQFVKDLKWKYDVLPADTLVDNNKKFQLFATGEAAMFLDAGDSAPRLLQYDMDINDMGVMALPAGPAKHVTLLGGYTYMMPSNATDDQLDAAVRWIETEYKSKVDDVVKETKTKDIETQVADGQLVGIKSMSVWSNDSEFVKWNNALIDKYTNINPNHVKLYNEFVANCPAEIRPEERICAQELYGILDNCIQEVWSDKNADVVKVLEKANSDFQNDYLNNF